MTDFWYYELIPDEHGIIRRCKMLLVLDENRDAKAKYNLTHMGIPQVSSYKELEEMFGPAYYDLDKIEGNK